MTALVMTEAVPTVPSYTVEVMEPVICCQYLPDFDRFDGNIFFAGLFGVVGLAGLPLWFLVGSTGCWCCSGYMIAGYPVPQMHPTCCCISICRHSCCGYDINERDIEYYNRTPLHGAALMGNKLTALYLMTHGADINALDTYGLTPLDLTVVKSDPYYKVEKHFNSLENWMTYSYDYGEIRSDHGRGAINDMLKARGGVQGTANYIFPAAARERTVTLTMESVNDDSQRGERHRHVEGSSDNQASVDMQCAPAPIAQNSE